MMEQLQLEEAWVIEIHPKGASRFRQLREVMADHLRRLLDGETPEWVAVAVRVDFEQAKKELSHIRREIRENQK